MKWARRHFLKVCHGRKEGLPPRLDIARELAVQNAVRELIRAGLVRSAHDCSEGGLAVALAECCFNPEGFSAPKLTVAAALWAARAATRQLRKRFAQRSGYSSLQRIAIAHRDFVSRRAMRKRFCPSCGQRTFPTALGSSYDGECFASRRTDSSYPGRSSIFTTIGLTPFAARSRPIANRCEAVKNCRD